jgi:glycosyltransferase involved in cell wall biosynthesis
MRFLFLTSTPMNIAAGSGTHVGISNLVRGLQAAGHQVEVVCDIPRLPNYTLARWIFNRRLRGLDTSSADVVVGFDLDGYRLPRRPGVLHIASLKGVVSDEARFESGYTRWSMTRQAAWERQHVHAADLVITTSEYSAGQAMRLYGLKIKPAIIPEAIDLSRWQRLLAEAKGESPPEKFTVLSVCRFYPRKRLALLLEAAARLRTRIPGLALRIVGGGPEEKTLHELAKRLGLAGCVEWRKDISMSELAREYAGCDLFCLPSVQEGFGVVFLEAMAAGKAVVAARAGAAPEVVGHGILVEPESAEALADGIERAYREPSLRQRIAEDGLRRVQEFELSRITGQFLTVVAKARATLQ